MSTPIAQADANASRAFFVQMLTRDIALEDCILDLLDNSVDGAWRSLGHVAPGLNDGADLSAFEIEMSVDEDRFVLRDNCGGMSQERAERYAFTFGRQEQQPEEEGDFRLGVYGIGMKRALFKLGKDIAILSTYLDDDGASRAFRVPIDVPTWMADPATDWRFQIYAAEADGAAGLSVEVRDLTPGTRAAFGNRVFVESLRRVIARDYTLHLNRGLILRLNGDLIEPWQITMLEGSDFAPQNRSWEIEVEGGRVHVELVAGAAAAPPDDDSADEEDEGEKRFGWYVACNGRIVLAADKTATSIWGADGFPIWHRQYRGFLGLILFTSEDTELLPLTTTKRSVDVSSEVFRKARPAMREVARAWIDYTGQRKQARERAKQAESTAKSVSIYSLRPRATIATPALAVKSKVKTSSIQYPMAVARIRKLAAKLGNVNMSATQVGSKSFDYAYDELVGED